MKISRKSIEISLFYSRISLKTKREIKYNVLIPFLFLLFFVCCCWQLLITSLKDADTTTTNKPYIFITESIFLNIEQIIQDDLMSKRGIAVFVDLNDLRQTRTVCQRVHYVKIVTYENQTYKWKWTLENKRFLENT
jgi:ABC-type glycerol-3-phosphate transport system permease component